MDYLPSKKFIMPVISVLVVIFAGYFAYIIWNSSAKVSPANSTNKLADNSAYLRAVAEASADTDNDGLKNWEEDLWKTDKLKADTDGDGSSDGDEIEISRNPLKAGKETAKNSKKWTDEFIPLEEKLALTSQSSTTAPTTLTELIAHDLMTGYFTMKKKAQYQELNPQNIKSLSDALFREAQQGAGVYRDIYDKSDIKVSEFAGIKTYLNNLGAMLDRNFKNVTEKEVPFVTASAQVKDFSRLPELQKNIDAYKKSVDDMEKMEVPPSYADLHVNLMNSFANTASAVGLLMMIGDDPMRSVLGMQLYYKEVVRASEFLGKLAGQIKSDKIALSENDEAGFFLQYFNPKKQ